MNKTAQIDLEAQISDLLDNEHDMLLAADFEKLKGIAAKKEELVSSLSMRAREKNPALTSELQIKAKQNARLYEAALLGLKLATTRLSELRTTLGELKTYDDRGFVTKTTTEGPSVSVKA